MFCSNCGSQIPDNSKFCANCGAQTTAPQPQTAAPQYQGYQPPQPYQPMAQPAAQPKEAKKKTPIWLSLIVVAIAFLIGSKVLAPAMVSSYEDTPATAATQPTVAVTAATESTGSTSSSAASSSYRDIFSEHNIVDDPSAFIMGDSACFAIVSSDGYIDKFEFAYENDVIHSIVETIYIPISDYTSDQVASLDAGMRETYGSLNDLGFCSVTFSSSSLYYKLTISSTDLDNSANLQSAISAGIITLSGDADFMSMSATESSLLAAGYAKK